MSFIGLSEKYSNPQGPRTGIGLCVSVINMQHATIFQWFAKHRAFTEEAAHNGCSTVVLNLETET